MKNIKFSKRLLSIALAGTIALTASGCAKRVDNKEPGYINSAVAEETVTPESTPKGTVTIGEDAEKIFKTSTGLTLLRYSDHLAIVSGDIYTTRPDNPLTNFNELLGQAVTTTEVNFRLVPRVEEGTIITTLNEGESLTIYGKTSDDWYLADANGTVGFICGDYIRLLSYNADSNYELANNTVNLVPAIKAKENVKIREGATTESKQLDLLRKDRSIKMIKLLDNGWYEVEYKGNVAYVNADYVTETFIVEGECYKVGYLKNDTYIYDAPSGNVTGTVSQYESGEIYALEEGYYLVATGDAQVGYVKKSDMGTLTDTAVVIDISAQTLTVYSGNKIVLTSPIVSGKDNEERHSDLGIFTVKYKEKDTYLTDGSTYNSHVDYWMPYNGGEGMHDAQWRSRFGGDIYKTNGSHGCINLPLEKAAELYNTIHTNDNVLVKR